MTPIRDQSGMMMMMIMMMMMMMMMIPRLYGRSGNPGQGPFSVRLMLMMMIMIMMIMMMTLTPRLYGAVTPVRDLSVCGS